MLKPVIVTLALLMACAGPRQDITPISDDARRHFTFAQINLQFAVCSLQRRLTVCTLPPPRARCRRRAIRYCICWTAMRISRWRLINTGRLTARRRLSSLSVTRAISPIRWRNARVITPLLQPTAAADRAAARFYQFLHDQVQPLIAAHYPVDSRRIMLAGHSFGGLFTLYVLFNHPRAFQRYVAASPSLWWNNGAVLPYRQPLVTAAPTSVTLTVGEYEEKPDPRHSADGGRQSQLRGRQQVTRARALAEHLQRDGVNSHFILFPGKDHGGVIPAAIDQALRVASAP